MSVQESPVTFGQMERGELETVLGWAATEGWNPGLEDASAFFETDPEGFFVARLGGAPIAAISVVNHSESFAFLGLYLCLPNHRGQGIGLRLWTHALAHAGQRTVGLDGVPDQQANYAASGFEHAGATVRFSGTLAPRDGKTRPATKADTEHLAALEAEACGYAKPAFMAAWLKPSATRQTRVLADETGFATIRKCRSGAKIGPLVAEDLNGAQTLIHDLATVFEGPISIDVPDQSTRLADYCKACGLAPTFATARMYRGAAPSPGAHVQAVATLELG